MAIIARVCHFQRSAERVSKAPLFYLGEDPFEVDPGHVKDIPLEMTVIGGDVVYQSAGGGRNYEGVESPR